jgi:signal transduction histidine kinase
LLAGVAAAGVAAAVVIAASAGMSGSETVLLLGWAVVGSALAAALAAGLLRLLRPASLVVQTAVITLAPVLAVAVGVVGASIAMFISAHDLHALFVVLVGAGAVGVVAALILGTRLASASTSLGELARRIGDGGDGGGPLPDSSAERGPGELADVAAQLEAASARLAESRAQARAVERSRRELVAWVSHDLRTPLAGIRAMVEALEDGLVDDPATINRYYRTMRREADRLARLVDDLFELSRIHAGALTLHPEPIALDELLSDAIAGVSPAAESKGVDLRGRVEPPPPVADVSIPEISRVVRNLLDNAIRHTPPGGSVRVEAGVDKGGRSALVSVHDSCGGIPPTDLPRVFELAYRGDAARTPGEGRAGLGLAVARGLVEAHHGDIRVENHGDGCRFTIRLPLVGPRR